MNTLRLSRRLSLLSLFTAGLVSSASADTVAYWRFEGDGITTPTPGVSWVEPTAGRTVADPASGIPVIDVSGNGNTVYTWGNNVTGHQYQSIVPASIIPQTGEGNSFSIQNNGNYPASFTWSAESLPSGINVESIHPLQWTIEASVYATTVDGQFRTFVGRDGNDVTTAAPANLSNAPLYFQMTNANQFRIAFADEAGNFWSAADTATVTANQWYNLAAVSDGVTLRLYKMDPLVDVEYQLVAETSISSSLAPGMAIPGTYTDGTTWDWTLGRGRYGTSDVAGDNHTDRFFGAIDEVRISDTALDPSQFLFTNAVPEPSVFLLLGTGALAALAFRKRLRK